MSTEQSQAAGTVIGFDLSVPDADALRDFYADVVGWRVEPLSMGDYDDYVMVAPNGTWVAGICHARGGNADLPPLWLSYVCVDDLDASMKKVVELGGEIIAGPKGERPNPRYVVIRDPAGAVLALREPQP